MHRVLFLGLALGATAISAQSTFALRASADRSQSFDIIVRNGTVIDGSGNPRFDADVGIKDGFIAAVGDLAQATATTQIDARGLFVTPGFINIHSHASADALPTAVNMLTQGVTTEIFNADGSGPPDLAQQLTALAASGLAVNIGGYIGFNSAWTAVVGNADRRPAADEIQRMRAMIATGLSQGAWGVSAGLDYKPAYFARTEDVITIVDVARPSRTNFTNHDRVTPESDFSSKAGIIETLVIGRKSGLVPVMTHMKITGAEKGSAGNVLASMAQAPRRGSYVAADAYPYLAGQTGLGSLIIPGWAQEGGRDAMLKRFADSKLRAQIIREAEQAMQARFGGPESVYLPRTRQQLTAVMKEMHAGPGETVLRILEQGDPGAILHFGIEEDLVQILKDPAERSQGIRFVLVNGTVALEDGVPTQTQSGTPLFRTVNMPSRPTNETRRSLSAKGTVSGHRVSINLTHRAGARQAAGTFDIDGFAPVETIGVLQTTHGWASVTGVDRMQRAVTLIVDRHDPANPGSATFALNVDGAPAVRGSLPLAAVSINTR